MLAWPAWVQPDLEGEYDAAEPFSVALENMAQNARSVKNAAGSAVRNVFMNGPNTSAVIDLWTAVRIVSQIGEGSKRNLCRYADKCESEPNYRKSPKYKSRCRDEN